MKICINQLVIFSKSKVDTPSLVSVFPTEGAASKDNTLFIICDGAKSGAIGSKASNFWTQNLAKALDKIDMERFGNEIFSHTIDQVANGYFTEFDPDRKETFRVGLAFLKFFEKGAYLASSEDCFVCQIRRSDETNYVYHSELINEPIENEFKLNTFITNDIKQDDCFFLCNQACMKKPDFDLLYNLLVEDGTDEQRMNYLAQQFVSPDSEFKAIFVSIKSINVPSVLITEKQTYNLNDNTQGGVNEFIDVVDIDKSNAEISNDTNLGDVNPDIGLHELKKPKFSKWMAFLIIVIIALVIWIMIQTCEFDVLGNFEHSTLEFIKAYCALG